MVARGAQITVKYKGVSELKQLCLTAQTASSQQHTFLKTSITAFSLSPTHLENNSGPLTAMKFNLDSVASACPDTTQRPTLSSSIDLVNSIQYNPIVQFKATKLLDSILTQFVAH